MEPTVPLATVTASPTESSIVEQARTAASDLAHLRHCARTLASSFCCAMRLELPTDAISSCNCCSDPNAFRLCLLPSGLLKCDPGFVARVAGAPGVPCMHATGKS